MYNLDIMTKYSHILINPESKRKLRIAAALNDTSMRETLDEALTAYLGKLEDIHRLSSYEAIQIAKRLGAVK